MTFTSEVLNIEENETINCLQVSYANTHESIQIQNPAMLKITSIKMYNIIGQSVFTLDKIKTETKTDIKTNRLSVGAYIIKLDTEMGVVNKKVIVN
ncbi:MAG TPA: T9SS type A sorting domain-containing protein [Xanthomarina sp.]|nr:T9SS type A sorting domain-containing protein [Xanthomarina sp.]